MNNDRLLVKKVLNGETRSFEELVISYYPGLYGFLSKMGIPTSDTENLAQEIFLKVFQDLYRYDDRWMFSAWFFKMAFSAVRRYKRKHPPISIPTIPEFLNPHESASDRTDEEALNTLLDPLHDEVRSMYILHYYNGFTLKEVGWIFGLSVSSVRMRMVKARGFLLDDTLAPGYGTSKSDTVRKIKRNVPCGPVPVESIMSLAEGKAGKEPGFMKRTTSPHALRKIWPVALPAFFGIMLIAILCIQDISKPFWESVMTIFDKEEQPVSVEMPPESTGLTISFSTGTDRLSGDDLVASLNDMGMDATPWQVLHANENQITIRNRHTIVCYRNGELYQVVDLGSFGLNGIPESHEPEFSFSPLGTFFVIGNNASDNETGHDTGVYLINVTNGDYYQLSASSLNQVSHSWSQSGNYLAFADKNRNGFVSLLDMTTLQVVEMEVDVPVTDLYVSNNGGVAVLSGDLVMTASVGDSAWRTETVQNEPFYVNSDSGTVWYVLNGVIMKHIMGDDEDTAIYPDPASETSADMYVTDYHISGNYLVFRMKNGHSGTLNLRTAKLTILGTSREMKTEYLPWSQCTTSGARIMFDNEDKFLIVSESSVTTPHIPGYSTLAPSHTRWVNEEDIAYVRMVNEEEPQAGEISIYTINVLTGSMTELYRSVDKEPVLNQDAPGSSNTTPPVQSAPDEADTIHETDKATGSRVESFVKTACTVKSGPGNNYADIGEIGQNEVIIYNNRVVNGWCLAQKVSGMLNYYDTRNAFWIRSENIHFYDQYSLPAGIVTADKVTLSKTSLNKGNLIRVVLHGEQRSYILPDTIDSKFGITGWVSNDSFTQDFNGVYFNQAYLKRGSTAYSQPHAQSELAADLTAHMASTGTDAFVNLADELENGFVHVTLPGGMAGWVREQDIYLPGKGGTSTPSDSVALDLNSDGIEERVSFTTDGKRYTLTVNGIKVDGHGTQIQPEYKLVDINLSDPWYEIVIEEHGPSNDYMSTFYYYDGQKLVNMGQVEGLCGNKDSVKGHGIVRSRTRGDILETWFFIKEYQLNSQRKLVETPSAFYEKIGYEEGSPLTLKIESLPFATSPGSDKISFLLYQNETVRFMGSDNQRWCLFQTDDGRNGWLEISGFWDIAGAGLTADQVFDGLNMAD